MSSEDSPFSSARSMLDDAGGWLLELLLPNGHDQRLDDDETCLEQAAVNIEGAIEALRSAGVEQVEVGTEIHDGYEMPILEPRVIDEPAARASDLIQAHSKGVLAWYHGGPKADISEAWIAELKAVLSSQFADRLAFEAELNDALAGAFEASCY